MAKTCANCGTALEDDDRFCGSCGSLVDDDNGTGAPPPPPPPSTPAAAGSRSLSAGAIGVIIAGVLLLGVIVLLVVRAGGDDPVTTTSAIQTTTTEAADTTNGASETTLAVTTTVGTEANASGLPPGVPYSDYTTVTDESNLIEARVPVEWTELDGSMWNYQDQLIGPAMTASSDIEGWRGGWETPGVFFAASDQLGITVDAFLDSEWFGEICTYDGREPYDDGVYTGFFDSYVDCDGTTSDFIVIAAEPSDQSALLYVQFVSVTDADIDALEQFVASFQLTGSLSG